MTGGGAEPLYQPRGTVLCVEDEADLLDDLACELREAGYSVLEASDGATALALIEASLTGSGSSSAAIDLVVCDVQLPGLSGLDLLRSLREQPDKSLPPFVLATAYGDAVMRAEADALGVSALIVKPVDYDDLLTLISELLPLQS